MNTKSLALIGLMSAVLCILGPMSLPIPISPVPISLGMLGVYLTVYILGMKKGTISVCIYLLLGLVGLPVFTAFGSGIGKVLGPTGGYLLGYIFIALIFGFFIDKWKTNQVFIFLGMILGTAVCYLLGTAWLAKQGGMNFNAALAAGVIPFIPGDLAKIILTMLVAAPVRKALWKAGILETHLEEKAQAG
ncbi:MAG: biotin transporter BioY [Lachnospiraceae bacterium]|nr:biotin transporter BioY [Lachnospiraceae bacterium]MDE7286175.1 biotin transporter BioY [Lachnospiraceae bacterium]